MAFKDFHRDFGLWDEPCGISHFGREAVGASSASVLGSIGRRLIGMEGINRVRPESSLGDLGRRLIESNRPPVSRRSSYGAFDRVLAAGALQSNVHKHITVADSGLGLASKAFTGRLAYDYSEVAKDRYLPTALRDVLSAEARIKELSSAYSGVATRLDGLAGGTVG